MQNSEAIKVAVLGGGAVVAKPLCLVQMVKRTRDLEEEEEQNKLMSSFSEF